jgi:tyrosine-protein kinase Etk/Wzc
MRKVDTSMKIVVRTLIRWFWLIIIFLVIGYVLGKVLGAVLPPTYQSTSIIQLNAETRNSQAQIIQPISAYSNNITSDSVLDPVLKQYPQIDRSTFIAKELLITPDTTSQSLQIQVTLPNRKMAADIANKLAQLTVSQQNAFIKAQYQKELQLVNARIAAETATINSLNQRYLSTPSTNTGQLQQLSDQISQERTLENTDISTQQALETEMALYSNPLSVIQSAQIATKPSSILGSIPYTALTLVLLFLIAIVIIAFIEQGAGRVTDPYMLQQKVALPLIGTIRWTKPVPHELDDTHTLYAEDCRMMMADMLFHAEEANAHVICLMGIRPHAGTTTLAAHLAFLLARSKRRVLLIDANLYQPSIHDFVGIQNEAGFAQMLEEIRSKVMVPVLGMQSHIVDQVNVDSFVCPTNITNLYVLPAGKPSLNPGDLLSMPEMGQILKWVSRSVDFVIVDCPALTYSVAHVLGTQGDQTFVVVDATKERIKQVLNIKQELVNSGVKLTGFIVNKLGRWI